MTGKQDWETPKDLFDKLDARFHFTIDGAASAENTKCKRFISEEMDAFKTELKDEVVFVNPPYNKMQPWAERFVHWLNTGNTVVVLCQDRTDTKWFKLLWKYSTEVLFLSGRVNFVGTETGNNRGSAVFIMCPGYPSWEPYVVKLWDWRNDDVLS